MTYQVFEDYNVGIVAHVDRDPYVNLLRAQLNVTVVSMDDGKLGCSGNHAHVQAQLAAEPGWSVILEDDAEPVNYFCDDLEWCLEHAPAPIMSLYLGTGYPQQAQHRIVKAVAADTSWIIHNRLLHAVGYCIHPDIKRDLAAWMSKERGGAAMEPDEAVSTWANAHQIPVAYTNPSLVDHRDGPTVMRVRRNSGNFAHGRNRPRKAHNTRQRLTWDDSAVTMER